MLEFNRRLNAKLCYSLRIRNIYPASLLSVCIDIVYAYRVRLCVRRHVASCWELRNRQQVAEISQNREACRALDTHSHTAGQCAGVRVLACCMWQHYVAVAVE